MARNERRKRMSRLVEYVLLRLVQVLLVVLIVGAIVEYAVAAHV